MIKTGEYGRFSLDEADVGDRLMVSGAGWGKIYQEVTITAVTKTRITTSDNRQWMRASRHLVGADRWTRIWLYAYDEALIQEGKQERLKVGLVRKIMGTKFSDLEMDVLKSIEAIIDAEADKAKAPEQERAA